MPKNKIEDPLTEEIGQLVDEVVLHEASNAVWLKFQAVLSHLEPADLDILEAHLDGVSSSEIALNHELSTKEVEQLLSKIKGELVNRLKGECELKH